MILAAVAADITLDVRGYSFTARRLAFGGFETLVTILLAMAAYRVLARTIAKQTWHWARPNRSWALALTSKVVKRASRPRERLTFAEPHAQPAKPADPDDVAVGREDLEQRSAPAMCRWADRPVGAGDRMDLGP